MTNKNNPAQLKEAQQRAETYEKNVSGTCLHPVPRHHNNHKTKDSPTNQKDATWLNREMSPGNKTNIKPSKRASLKTNVAGNGNILVMFLIGLD